MGTIINAKNIPLNQQNTYVPDVSGALQNYFQKMVFTTVVKSVVNFQLVETPTNINFWGTIQPFSDQQLRMLPEGQRTQWQYYTLHAEPALSLTIDDVINYLGVQYRVQQKKNYTLYGFNEWVLITDWSGSGPNP